MPVSTSLDVSSIRRDFPILAQRVHDRPLVYFDNAATSQKPKCVVDAITRFYLLDNANIHRGVHQLSERSTQAYENARVKVQRFLSAADSREIIFVRGATEGINLVAQAYGRKYVGSGDEIVISALEHHSNIVPWQMLCEEKGAVLRVIPINDRGELELDKFEKLLNPHTRLIAVSHISNALGTINPVREIVGASHRWNNWRWPVEVGGQVRHVGRRFVFEDDLTMMEPYTTADLFAFVDIPGRDLGIPKLDTTRVAFRVRNVTDKVYAAFSDPGYQDQIYLGAPRTYEVATSFRW